MDTPDRERELMRDRSEVGLFSVANRRASEACIGRGYGVVEFDGTNGPRTPPLLPMPQHKKKHSRVRFELGGSQDLGTGAGAAEEGFGGV